jgi:hypothetical protein
VSTTSSSQPAGAGRGRRSSPIAAERDGRHERFGDALIASYVRELLEADPAAAELPVDVPAAASMSDPVEDAELAS